MQAYIDESFEENGVFVLGGCIATAESWVGFSRKWEELLNSSFGLTNNQGQRYFKMQEMAETPGRMANVPAFFRVIEEHVLGFISTKIDISELRRAQSRIIVPKAINPEINWGDFANPYYIAFRCLMDKFHSSRQLPFMQEAIKDHPVDFIFDDKVEKKIIISSWDEHFKNRKEELKKFYGTTPIFKDDKKFLPLQAADFWAWWVRKWYLEGTPEKIENYDFGSFKRTRGVRKHLQIEIFFNEEHLVKTFINIVRNEFLPQGYEILDKGRR
ncbi:MAG TPA: DUF3800 domain-containing protein [Gammaproteobacteria bacterium]